MKIDHETLILRATKAHRLRCQKMGEEAQQPCSAQNDVEEDGGAIMVVLRNVNGTLARYEYDPRQDRLRWIDPDSVPKSYEVVCEDIDTRIQECDDDEGEYETFEDAKEAALDYLGNLIEGCRARFDDIDQAGTFEESYQLVDR